MIYPGHLTFFAKAVAILAISLTIFAAYSSEHALVRDENIIFELLTTGEIDLSKGVAKEYPTEQSVTNIRRIGLHKGDLRMRAAFRDKSYKMLKKSDTSYNDTYYHELAAYVISKHLGLNIVPPTVLRSIPISKKGLKHSDELRKGTLQFWVENTMVLFDLNKQGIPYPGKEENKNRQIREITAFDCIIGNVDRHAGNLLIDLNERYFVDREETVDFSGEKRAYLGKIWAIDHSKAFYRGQLRGSGLCPLNKLNKQAISVQFAEGMQKWDISEIERLLRETGLSDKQIASLRLESVDQRFQQVRQHFQQQLQQSSISESEFYSSGYWHKVQ